ncbi:MAG: CHAT domain-containing protein [Cyanobacteria bacterium P01_A01_bin.135]
MTQEFHVSITPVRNDEYLIRTEKVATGVPLAEQQIIWPIADWLQQAQQLMGDPITGLLRDNRLPAAIAPPPDETSDSTAEQSLLNLMDLGQQMYNHLFQGILRDSWMTAQGIAQHRGEVLRLRLGLKGDFLPRLPWEVMHSSGRESIGFAAHPLATGTNVLFSRYQPNVAIAPAPFSQHPPEQVRMLMVVSAPSDQGQLKLAQEAQQLRQEIGVRPASASEALPEIQITILEQPGRKELAQALEQGNYQILHYAGHSDVAAAGGQIYLVNSRTGLTESLSGNDLAGLLVNNGVRIAVFNSCRGSYTATDRDGGRNLTEALTSRGVPAVLAMAEQIPDDVALTLTRLLYRNLRQGYPIDLSLSRARQGLVSAYGSTQLYWALPTLYIHPDFNGYLASGDRSSEEIADSLARLPHAHAIPLSKSAASAADSVAMDQGAAQNLTAAEAPLYLGQDDLDDLDNVDLGEEALETTGSLNLQDYNVNPPLPSSAQVAINPSQPSDGSAIAPAAINDEEIAVEPAVDEPTNQRPSPTVANDAGVARGNGAAVLAGSRWGQLLPNRAAALLLLVPVGLALVVGGAVQLSRGSNNSNDVIVSEPANSEQVLENIDAASTEAVRQVAEASFTQNDFDAGEEALTELLDRGTLEDAEAALEAVPDEQIIDPRINFLHGRLAWEALKRDIPAADPYEARRYWDFAVKQSSRPLYYNALGFALYSEGRTEAAMGTWLEALALLEQQGVTVPEGLSSLDSGEVVVPEQIADQDALTAYAGLALAMALMSANPAPGQPPDLLSKALQIQQVVMQSDPANFQPESLKQNWLWTDAMVKEWEILQGLRSQ